MNDYSAREKRFSVMYETVLKAGEALMKYFRKAGLSVNEKSYDNPVTEADLAANEIIVEALKQNFPEDGFLSEELLNQKWEDRAKKEFVWLIDPLDGTKQFIKGKDEFSVSVGLLEKNIPVLGFVYNPAKDFFLAGGKGLGLYLNQKKLEFVKQSSLQENSISIVVSSTELKENLFSELKNHTLTGVSSVAYKMALVAKGDFLVFLSKKPKNEWDIAAGAALLKERGYLLYDGNFKPIFFNKKNPISQGIICGHPESLNTLRNVLSFSK